MRAPRVRGFTLCDVLLHVPRRHVAEEGFAFLQPPLEPAVSRLGRVQHGLKRPPYPRCSHYRIRGRC